MKLGDKVRVKWPDGFIKEGLYVSTERGYVILRAEDGEKIICGHSVKFEVINELHT
jgi:hypothetical protein